MSFTALRRLSLATMLRSCASRVVCGVLAAGSLASVAPLASAQQLDTIYTGGNGLGTGAIVYFDLNVTTGITIQSLDVNLSSAAGTACTLDVYVTGAGGTYVGNTTNAGAWTLVATGTGTAAGNNLHTPVDISDFTLNPGTYGVGVKYTGAGMNYTNGNGTTVPGSGTNQTYTAPEFTLLAGCSQAAPFTGALNNPRVWNGTIYYIPSNPSATGACCTATAACTFGTAGDCQASGGFFSGASTSCTPNVCPHRGACCAAASNACTLSNDGAAGCTAGAVYQGDATTCNPNNCPQSACCNAATGVCTFTGSGSCASGTTNQGAGTVCTPNPCPQPPPPSNDECGTAISVTAGPAAATGTTAFATASVALTATNTGSCTQVSFNTGVHLDVWYSFVPTTSGSYNIDTCGSAFDTILSVHSACPADQSNILDCNDDSTANTACTNSGLNSRIASVVLTAGQTYFIAVGGYNGGSGVYTLNISTIVSGACCNTSTAACTTSTIGSAGCAAGTAYQGDNTVCAPSPCPREACCNTSNGACTIAGVGACPSGTSGQGPGTSCSAATCPGVGTCCSSLGNCLVRFDANCPSGLTSNPSLTCTPGLCPATGAQICQAFDTDAPGTLPANWSSTSTGAGAPWVIDTTSVNSAPNAVFTNDVATVSSQFLQLPAVTAAGPLTLDFLSSFTTENTFDGFVIESSTDGGNTWTDLVNNGAWVLNGYNVAAISVNFASPIAGRPAFSGIVPAWTEHIGTITANPGDSVIIRFQMATDQSVASTGVWLDDICIGGIQATGGSGVCCRGSTCSTTVASAAACTSSLVPGQTAGATFVPASSACNTTGNNTTPCCYANYNKAGGISVQDIFDFLNDWFAGSAYANVGGSGGPGPLAVQNIFDFLNAWFAGGC